MPRIYFLNPFGTPRFDQIIRDTVTPYLRSETEMVIGHLTDCPRNIDYYVPKHLVETQILKAVAQADSEGFDAFVIGCCYDPGLTAARELTDMPVIGPLEASAMLARAFGHRYAVVTDHTKAVPELEDRLRVYGMDANCRSVTAVNWFVDDMLDDPGAVALSAHRECSRIMEEKSAETVIIGCTIVAACYESTMIAGTSGLPPLSIINPNVAAVKMAELLGDLYRAGQYRISRRGYYQQHAQHDAEESREVLAMLGSMPYAGDSPSSQ